MNMIRTSTVTTAVLVAVAAGVLTGVRLQVASAETEDASKDSSVGEPTWAKELPPNEILGNGDEAGLYRLETPLKERPEYGPAQLSDGTPGYVKYSDIDDGFSPPPHAPGAVVDVTEEVLAAQKRGAELMVKPNEKGEIWAPLYDKDGVTVLGHVLMNSGARLD